MVYDDAEKLYAEVAADGEDLIDEAFSVLTPRRTVPLSKASSIKGAGSIIGFNTTFFERREVVEDH